MPRPSQNCFRLIEYQNYVLIKNKTLSFYSFTVYTRGSNVRGFELNNIEVFISDGNQEKVPVNSFRVFSQKKKGK